jgi:hypothetical protein
LQQQAFALWPAAATAPAAQALPGLVASAASLASGVLRHVAAVLSFDSWAAPAMAAGMRSLRSPTRHLLYSAQGRDIDLRIAPEAGAFVLSGQILGPDESGELELVRQDVPGAGSVRATLDALGGFQMDALAAGTYTLTLRVGGEEIVLPPVQVGAQGSEPGG